MVKQTPDQSKPEKPQASKRTPGQTARKVSKSKMVGVDLANPEWQFSGMIEIHGSKQTVS